MVNDELRYVNAVIGFFKPAGDWPCPFRDLEYELIGIQRPVLSIVAGAPRRVVPELVCASVPQQHVFAMDVKTARLNKAQAEGYAALNGEQMTTQGFLGAGFSPASTEADAVFVTSSVNAVKVNRRLDAWDLAVSTIEDDGNRFVISHGQLTNDRLNQAFSAGIDIHDPSAWPTHFISTSSESTLAELAPHVLLAVSSYIIQGTEFTVADIGRKAIEHWKVCGDQEQRTYINKMHELLSEAYLEELDGFLKPDETKGGAPVRDCRWIPENIGRLHFRRRTSLMNSITDYCERKVAGSPFIRNQPRLF